ncbi:hypothetical protein [Streptomyces rochei]|uniref:hypothetical protein n=1 Tax=Streptomyces rochei TaxID=1928 RepID=UPI0036904622
MDQRAQARQQLAEREAHHFITAVTELTTALPHPHGPAIRITLTATETGEDLGTVDIDLTNLWSVSRSASARANTPIATGRPAPTPAVTGRPKLHVVGGGQ